MWWHCESKAEGESKGKVCSQTNTPWRITLTLPGGKHLTLPFWAVFWVIGPLMWWGVQAPYVLIVIGVALLIGVRVQFGKPPHRE